MPLILETFNEETGRWVELNQIIPGDPGASFSDNTVLGRYIYLFNVEPDDQSSTILKSMAGGDAELPGGRRLIAPEVGQLDIHKELRDGEEYELKFTPDNSIGPRVVRFRHVTIDFGTRHCLICEADLPAKEFGRHVFAHDDAELAEWPGGSIELVKCLRRSTTESIKRAKGFPRVQEHLKRSYKSYDKLEKRLKANLN